MEQVLNQELKKVNDWLCANKLILNIQKTNFIVFHTLQRKLDYDIQLTINNQLLNKVYNVKYLGVMVDCHLNWKAQVMDISKKMRRNTGAISKIRNYVNIDILVNLYYSLIYPFLTNALIVWGNTYKSTIDPIFILQKKVIRLITFSGYFEHTNSLFATLKILKVHDLAFYQTDLFMYDYKTQKLPEVFDDFFTESSAIHNYNTRLASRSSFYVPKVKTNYGKFNIRFAGVSTWNTIPDDLKNLPSKSKLKKQLSKSLLQTYY